MESEDGNKRLRNILLIICAGMFLIFVSASWNQKTLVKEVRSDPTWCLDYCQSVGMYASIFYDGKGCACSDLPCFDFEAGKKILTK